MKSAFRLAFPIACFLIAPALAPAQAPVAPASAEACNWVDGLDPNGPTDDAGRGVTDWNAHQQYVAAGAGLGNAHALVGARIATLKSCLGKDAYARIYADLSILVGQYGRAHGGWVDGSDPAVPHDDGGRGISNWDAHRDYVTVGIGYGNANTLVANRLQTLSASIAREVYARLYADVSVLIARSAQSAASTASAPAPTPTPVPQGPRIVKLDEPVPVLTVQRRRLFPSLTVKVLAADGTPVDGATVRWSVTKVGDGMFCSPGHYDTGVSLTDKNGFATWVTFRERHKKGMITGSLWVRGAGVCEVTVSSDGVPDEIFQLTATSDE